MKRFWGIEVRVDELFTYTFEEDCQLSLTMAVLGNGTSKEKTKVSCAIDDGTFSHMCSLPSKEGDKLHLSSVNFMVRRGQTATFRIDSGDLSVHISGYMTPGIFVFDGAYADPDDLESCDTTDDEAESKNKRQRCEDENSDGDLKLVDMEIGLGKIAKNGDKVTVFYTGWLKKTGYMFDSNKKIAPYSFRLGENDVIDGWNEGIKGMQVGGRRRIIIPPRMGYGQTCVGKIPKAHG